MKVVTRMKHIKWWVGKQKICGGCGIILELEEGDKVKEEYTGRNEIFAIFKCVECGYEMFIEK